MDKKLLYSLNILSDSSRARAIEGFPALYDERLVRDVSMDFGSKQNHLLQLSVRSVSRLGALEIWIISQSNLRKNYLQQTKKNKYYKNQNAKNKTDYIRVVERKKTAGETRWLRGFTPKRKATKIFFHLCDRNQEYQSE